MSLDQSYKPSITFVVVQKRHHTRFFPLDKRDSDKTGNCLPGTVIESGITHPYEFDFCTYYYRFERIHENELTNFNLDLQSHAGLQGTSRPTHYHVLFDENTFTSDG